MLLPLKAVALGVPMDRVGFITAASFFLDFALVPVAGYIMDNYGRKHATVPALAATALGFAIMTASSSEATLFAASLILGLGNGLSNGWVQTVGVDLAPPGKKAQFLGVWNLFMGFGQMIGPVLVGFLSQMTTISMASITISMVSASGALSYLFLGTETRPVTANSSRTSFRKSTKQAGEEHRITTSFSKRRQTRFLPGLVSQSSDTGDEKSNGYSQLRP